MFVKKKKKIRGASASLGLYGSTLDGGLRMFDFPCARRMFRNTIFILNPNPKI